MALHNNCKHRKIFTFLLLKPHVKSFCFIALIILIIDCVFCYNLHLSTFWISWRTLLWVLTGWQLREFLQRSEWLNKWRKFILLSTITSIIVNMFLPFIQDPVFNYCHNVIPFHFFKNCLKVPNSTILFWAKFL